MSHDAVTREGVGTFGNIDDLGDHAQAMSPTSCPSGWRGPCRDRTRRIHRPPNHEGHETRTDPNGKDGVPAIKAENEEEKTPTQNAGERHPTPTPPTSDHGHPGPKEENETPHRPNRRKTAHAMASPHRSQNHTRPPP